MAAYLEYDWKEAERRFRLAMARDPVPVIVRLYYAWVTFCSSAGRPKPFSRWISDCKQIR